MRVWLITASTCERCGRREATEHMYWYAMGRLHDMMPKTIAAMRQVIESTGNYSSYCWLSITAIYDGPYGYEYAFGHEDCMIASGRK